MNKYANDDPLMAARAEILQLRQAMSTRAPIEQAKGMLMLLLGCDANCAFDLMVRVSQRTHAKVHDVAHILCDEVAHHRDVPGAFAEEYSRMLAPIAEDDSSFRRVPLTG